MRTTISGQVSSTARRALALLLALALMPLLAPAPARAAGYTVTTLADSGAGSLRQAIEDANASAGADTITFTISGPIVLASTLPVIAGELTIDGSGQAITISGEHAVQVLVVEAGASLRLHHLTVANGRGIPDGGGIHNNGGTVTISYSTVSGNSAPGSGGGIVNFGGTVTISNSTLSGNSATFGGGIFNSASALTVTNSTFSANSAGDFGGGGIYNAGGTATVTNSTFSANSTSRAGGGIYNTAGTLTVTNSTFSANGASRAGGGIWNVGTLHLRNTIIADSPSGGDCAGSLAANVRNLIEDGSCSPALSGDPNLGPLADNGGPTLTIALLPGSPAIDAAEDSLCPATDQRGVARPQGAACDIGAYELQATFAFSGFFQPIDNLPTVNSVKAGQAVPVSFSLGGDQGLNIFAAGYPKAHLIACDGGAPSDEVETVAAGASGLSYDPATDTYTYVWKTSKSWAGSCRLLVVTLSDGSEHLASFRFK